MRLLIFLAAAVVAFLFLRWLIRQPRPAIYQFMAVAVGLGLVVLAATGRLNWIAAVVGALLPFVRRAFALLGYLPLLKRFMGTGTGPGTPSGPGRGGVSTVSSRFLRMWLNHATGEMEGEILEGQHQGARLSALSLDELRALYRQYRASDRESADLLQAYLDRVHGEDWHTGPGPGPGDTAGGSGAPQAGRMSREEAWRILGLEPGASHDEIIAAHRRLMQKLHPDRGGSTYLAAKINQAKDVLLG